MADQTIVFTNSEIPFRGSSSQVYLFISAMQAETTIRFFFLLFLDQVKLHLTPIGIYGVTINFSTLSFKWWELCGVIIISVLFCYLYESKNIYINK